MSGQLVLMALTLIAPDARRLFSFFVLGRPTGPCPLTPIFGGWRRLDRAAVVLRTLAFAGFAALMLHQSYKEAVTRGIWAPENPAVGRWVGREFVRDGQSLPFPEQPADAPPRQISPSKWQGGPGIPAVVRVAVARSLVTLMFEDGSGVSYRNASPDVSEFVLVKAQGGGPVGRLRVTFPEPDVMVLEGPLDEQELRMTLGRVAAPAKEYPLRTRGFHWVQDVPFNR